MKHFTIDAENNIVCHDSGRVAKQTGAGVFSTEEQLADLIGPDNKRLLEIWNSLPGVQPVTKFANRKTATERIWKALQQMGGRSAEPAQTTEATDATQIPEPETPFDPIEVKPHPVASEHHQDAIESAAGSVADQPAPALAEPDEPVATTGAQEPEVAPGKAKVTKKATSAKNAPKGRKAARAQEPAGPREGSKTAQVIAMLRRNGGATLAEIMQKFGWQRHTVRGFMAGAMKKAGYTVESFKPEGGERTYRLNK